MWVAIWCEPRVAVNGVCPCVCVFRGRSVGKDDGSDLPDPRDPLQRTLRRQAAKHASHPVLIVGGECCGKTVLAKAIMAAIGVVIGNGLAEGGLPAYTGADGLGYARLASERSVTAAWAGAGGSAPGAGGDSVGGLPSLDGSFTSLGGGAGVGLGAAGGGGGSSAPSSVLSSSLVEAGACLLGVDIAQYVPAQETLSPGALLSAAAASSAEAAQNRRKTSAALARSVPTAWAGSVPAASAPAIPSPQRARAATRASVGSVAEPGVPPGLTLDTGVAAPSAGPGRGLPAGLSVDAGRGACWRAHASVHVFIRTPCYPALAFCAHRCARKRMCVRCPACRRCAGAAAVWRPVSAV